ncbi:PLxRFG domain-containing protein [Acinetobacter sp. UBA2581]|uniref:PLxRFG domain-containing protein n=1 Tax=Acinetobacter sp. UBA2581 TaxID=1945932 RepID=UPI00257E3C5C|nr:PLxRFG domain-containing protein [Acinetobacter sp. UBA2581]
MSEQKKPWEQSWNQPAETSVSTQNKKPWEHKWNGNPEPEVEKSKGFSGHVRDIGASLAAGAASLPDVAIGIGDILTGSAVGKTVEDSGLYTPGSGREYWADKKTDQAKAQSQKFSDAEGIIDKTKVALTNPTLITNTVAESLPTMVAGGLVGRGLSTATKGAISPMVGGAIGEGTMMAGSQAENIRQQTDDGLLTGNQVAASVATGALGTLFGLAGGAVAKKFGFGDIDSMLAGANAQQVAGEIAKVPLKQVPKHVVLGALSEGLLEELPQSAQEQVLQNYALNKDLMDGVDDAIVMGALAGMTMGGAASGLNVQGHNQRYNAQEQLKVAQQAAQQAQETQAMRDAQSQLFGGDVPDPVLDPSKLNPFSDNAPIASPIIDMNRLEAADGNPRYENGVNYAPPEIATQLSLVDEQPQQADNGIDFERPEQGQTDLERQIQFNNTFGLETPDPVVDYNGISPFDNNPQKPIIDSKKVDLTPSEQMGLDPNLGPLSAAAATAVDSGVSQQMQIEMQAQAAAETTSNAAEKTEDSNVPLQQAADAARELTPEQIHGKQNTYGADVTTAIEQLKQRQQGEQNAPITFDEGIQNGTIQQGNAPINNGSQSVSEQYDTTTASAMGATTGTAQKGLQPAKSDAGQIVPPNQSLNEIQTSEAKSKLLDAQSKVTELEAQLVIEKSVPKKAQIRKQITELQNELSIQTQSDVNIDSPQKSTVENHRENFAKMDRSIAKVNAVRQRMREANPEIFTEANDRVRETHGLTNARVTAIADEIESSGSYELSDREYDKVKNNPNYKIDYNPKTFIGKVTAVKDQHSGEWLGNNEDSDLDNAAHAAATSIQNDLPEPTQAQIEAGNYKKGHIKVHGLDIAVENPRGSERRGTDPDGKEWAHTMSDHYGYIKKTTGADNEHIDTYVGRNPESEQIFVVDQIDQKTGGFDEHKVMMGFNSQEDAVQAYSSNFDKGWKVGPVRAMNKDEFKTWLKDGDTKKPAGETVVPQSETTLDPQNVQRDYGDSLESVMADVETLADEFTIDLHSVPKKRNALKNPNYHAVQHENGRVEILGMKHPATGKWVGKAPKQEKALVQDSPAPAQKKNANGTLMNEGTKTNSEKPDGSKAVSLEKPAVKKPKEVIQDFGEKIGGARKDTAVKTGKKPVAEKPKDDRPTWAKRFEISEIAASSNPAEVGKWTISDTKNKDWMGNNRRLTNQMFNSQEEAEKFLPVAAVAMKHRVTTDTKDGKKGYIIVRTVSDRKHVQVVQQLFDTRDAANEYLVRHAQEILETNTTFGELDLPRPENTQRTGVARREGDAKDSDFSRVFGFRGVEFGNWNNQAERQELLNDAFDGLMDLAEVLNIPPEALSLNGELALAFGARGQGLSSAKAHYESNRVVINLTKMNGAGSLAHEWWHAFDHYLSRQDGSASSAWIQHEDGSRSLNVKSNPADRFASHGFKVVKSGVREDVRNAFEKLMVTMFKKSQAYIEDTQAADEFVARSRDEVQDKLNSIRENLTKQLDPQYYKRFNKPASADQLAEFDTAAELIITGQLLETEARKNPKSRSTFGGYRHTNDALDKINEIFKAVRGRSGFNADFKGVLDYLRGSMSRYMSRLKMLADAQQSTTKYKSVPTEFAMNAKELDQGRGSDYWTTPHEMSARAFQGYVEDKIAAKNARSPFLNYGPENVGILTPYGVKRPFPSGEERVAINQAFDDLIGGLQTEKTDTGSRLYSRAQDNVQSGQTPEQVREALVERFGEKTISSLERRGLLDIVSTVDEPGVEGFYQNGRVTLVASNLNETSIIPTFLHELGGHGGFQNVMSEEKYADLMGIFNDMVQRKHPLALEAKRLAERETDAKTQQLEYLPYLLTLASTQQEMNALQKSAIKRFIDKVVSAVKAWAFDRLGINLNLNENDMVALANRMIQQQIAEPTSVENVRAQLQGTDQWMKAPNGQPTNLTEQQWLQVRTPEFKQWFGDWENSPETASKVVDENGEPQVVYHGTSSQFTRFKLGGGLLGRGVYLTDRYEEAQNYAGSRSQNSEGTVMPLFANIPEMFDSNSKTTREQIVGAMQDGFNGIRHQFNDMDYLVAFNPEQVKSAVGNTGLFSSQDTDIRFSRQANAQQIIQNLVGNMNKQGRNKLKTEAGYKATHALQYVLGALGRRQLTELYQKLLPQLKPYNDMVAMMDADQNEVAAMSDELARRWADLKDEKELANVMHDATLAKIDPAKPYQPGDNVAEYAKLKKQFDALSDDAKKVYREARDAYKKHHRDVRQAIQDRILRSSMSNQKKTELLQQMDANFFGYTQGVYFPLQRFGKYVVLVRDAKDQVISVSRAETLSEAHKLREILHGDYPNAKVHKPMLDKEYDAARDGVGRGFMTNLFNELGSFGLNAQRQAELEDILGQLYLKSLPDLSYAKHSVHRKGTAGFSQDARRAFAQNMFHGGSYLAKLRYKDQLEEMLDGMQKHASEQAKIDEDYEQPVAQQVIDEMNKRHKNMMEANSHPLSTALTSLGFLYYLGLSPASAAVNTLQTVLVAYPQMGAKWGYDKAGAALAQASNDFRKGVSIKGINPKNWENDIAKILKGDELKAYEEAVRRGVIDVTMAHDLAGIAQGEDSGVMWKLRPVMRVASTLFHNAERFNREVTFIAAYRLARDSGSMHDQAFEQAMDSTYKGHFDYSSGNRPRIMQGNIAKVILLFKQFGQNMIYTLARTAHQSLKGETPEARREAQRALAGIIGMHTVFAGVMGLPLVGPILAMASMLGSDDDEPWDAEAALRNALADALGTKTSEVLMKGASRFGPADLSGRVGINNLLLPDVQDGLEGKDFSDAMVMSGLGPVVGILTNTFKGLAEIGQGHGMRGVETMSPVFLRSPLRSIRYATEGAQDKTGVMIKDDVGVFSLAAQAVGFSPSEVRLATEGRSAIYSHTKRLDKRRTELMNDYVRAVQRDDMDGQKEIWAEIQAFNQKNPSRRISRVQAMQSLRQREKRVKQAEHGIYLPNKKREDADIGRFAFDE